MSAPSPLDTVSKIAPSLGAAMMAPGTDPVFSLAMDATAKAFNVRHDEVPAALEQAIATSAPDTYAKILEAQRQFQADVQAHVRTLMALGHIEGGVRSGSVIQDGAAMHGRKEERLAYLAYGGFVLLAMAILWKGIPTDPTTVAIVTTLANQAFGLANGSFSVFTGASLPPSPLKETAK